MVPLLYIVTDRHATRGRDLVDVVERALTPLSDPSLAVFASRVAVQLREKDLDTPALLHLAERLRAVTARAKVALFVNGRADVAFATGCDGVHLARNSADPAAVRQAFPDLRVGVSTHSVAEIERVRTVRIDFVCFGPIHPTPSKIGLIGAKGLHGLTEAAALGVPVVALGGLDASNANSCFESGAVGIACIRSVMSPSDPADGVRGILATCEKPL